MFTKKFRKRTFIFYFHFIIISFWNTLFTFLPNIFQANFCWISSSNDVTILKNVTRWSPWLYKKVYKDIFYSCSGIHACACCIKLKRGFSSKYPPAFATRFFVPICFDALPLAMTYRDIYVIPFLLFKCYAIVRIDHTNPLISFADGEISLMFLGWFWYKLFLFIK